MAANPSQGKLPVIRIENLGAGQENVPFTFGQVFKVSALMPGQGLAGQLSNGDLVPLQIDQKATHADGSVRHAIISGVLPTIFEKEERELKLVTAKAGAGKPFSLSQIPDGVVELTVDGTKYSTNGSKFGDVIEWLSGGVVAEGIVAAELRDSKGNLHPHLTVRAGIRAYSTGHLRVEVIVENTTTFTPGANNFKYDVAVSLNGKKLFEQKALTHYHHARWHKTFWIGDDPMIHVKHDPAYVISTKAVPNYDLTAAPQEKNLAALSKRITAENSALMAVGPINKAMPTTGGRPDIGPLPSWYAMYLLSADKRARDVMMVAADGAGSWSVHYRDENTGYPVRIDSDKNKNISTHMNLGNKGPLPVPRFATGKATLSTPYTNDTAHQPSLAYLPYLLTGEYYYLEELQFWASSNVLETDPGIRQFDKGLVNWQQVRGQAWSLRTLAHAAYITPDNHPLKEYFVKQVDNNIEFYHQTYVEGNPNKLGVYDGSGKNSFPIKASAPWQDDFLTWSFGNLVELGFEKALPILEWKAKYPVGRMTDPEFCWMAATAYHMEFRPSAKEPLFENLGDMYRFNFSGDKVSFESKTLRHPDGLKFIDQPCGSKEQAAWLTKTNGYNWDVGRMVGFSDSTLGYPANMQPALALAAQFGVAKADKAWERFDSRARKPDYRGEPQFAIVPRATEVVEEEPAPEEEKNSMVVRGLIPSQSGLISITNDTISSEKKYTVVILEE